VPSEIIQVRNGRANLSDAVMQVAQVFNPLGAAAPIIATLAGCATEIYRFKKLDEELRRRHEIATGRIRTRQGEIIGLFESRLRDSRNLHVSLTEMHSVLREVTATACRPGISDVQCEYAHVSLRLLSEQIRGHHADAGNNLIRLSDSLHVAETWAAIEAWRALEGR
jgi:hypothetical protein